MDSTLLIIAIVISALSLGVCVVLLVTVLKSKKAAAAPQENPETIAIINANLQSLHNDVNNLSGEVKSLRDSVPLVISAKTADQMTVLQKSFADQAQKDNDRMVSFQTGVNKALNERMDAMGKTINDRMDVMNKTLVDNTAAMNKKVDDNFTAINKQVNDSLQAGFKTTGDTMSNLKETLGKMTEAQTNLENLQKDVVSLNNVLTSNQTRGQYGEMQLNMILEATFPDGKGTLYDTQYFISKGKDGADIRPDAVIFFARQHAILCIDSKFPLTHYATMFGGEKLSDETLATEKDLFKKDVKAKFGEVASKYIIPGITTAQAIIFIPNDGIFAYIHSEFKDVVEEGLRQNVVMASPSILQPILVTFHAAQIDSERAANLQALNEELASLGKDFRIFGDKWQKLHENVDRLENTATDVDKTIKRMGKKFDSIKGAEIPEAVDEKDETAEIAAPIDDKAV